MKTSLSKLVLLAILFCTVPIGNLSAQCINTIFYTTGNLSAANTTPQLIGGCTYAGEYNNLTIGDAGVYNFTSTISTDYITITDNLNNVISSGTTPLAVPVPTAGSYRIHVNTNASCGTVNACRDLHGTYLSSLGGCLPVFGLAVSNITINGATLTWNAPSTPPVGFEYIVATTSAPPAQSAQGTTTTATTAVLTTLNPSTTYFFWIRVDCGTDSSVWVSTSFFTPCVPVTDFYETFDNVTAPALPNCFQQVGANGNVTTYDFAPNISSPNVLYLYDFSGLGATLALPEVSTINSGTHRLVFQARAWFDPGVVLQVGYVTDINNAATFVSLQSITITSTTYNTYIANLGTTPPANSRLAIRHTGNLWNEVLIENMAWEQIPPCAYPIGLAGVPAGPNGATITWLPGGNETQWEVVVMPAGTGPPTGSGTIANTTSHLETGLTTGASYDAYVRSICGALSSTWQMVNFAIVPCASGATQTFDTKIASVSIDGNTVTSPVGPGNCATYTDYTSLPPFQMAYGLPSTIQVAHGTCGGNFNAYVKVYIDFNNDLNFDPVNEMVAEGDALIGGMLNTTANMPTVPSYLGVVRLRVVLMEGGSTTTTNPCGTYAYGESQDFLVNLNTPPSCLPPSALNITGVTDSSFTLNWVAGNASQAGWIIEHGPAGFVPGTGTINYAFFTNSFTITGLSQQSNYQVYLTELCSVSDSSLTMGPISITTSQVPVSVFPYFEGFENGTNNWGLGNGTQTNQWHVGTATSFAGTSSAYMSNDGGLTNTYSSAGFIGSVNHLYRDFSLPMGSAVIDISFAWNAQGEGFYDYLRVWVVPTSFNPTPGVQITATGTAPTGRIQLGTDFNQPGIIPPVWTLENFTLPPAYEGQSFRLIFEWRHDTSLDNQPPAAVDNVAINLSNCPAPTALAAAISLTSTNTTLSWTSNASLFNLQIGPAGFVPTGTPTQTGVSNPYVATGFVAGQQYQYYVQANCGTDVSAWSGPYNFIPGVGIVTTYPPLQNTNGSGGITFEIESNQPVYVSALANLFSSSGPVNVWIRPGGVLHLGATFPDISTTNGWIQIVNGTQVTSVVNSLVVIPGTYGFVLPANSPHGVFIEANTSYQTHIGPPDTFTDGIMTIRTGPNYGFGGIGPNPAFTPRQFLGTVYYTTPPACLPPTSFTTGTATTTTIPLTWGSGNTGSSLWVIEYGPQGFTPGTGTIVTSANTNYTVTNLTPATSYSFYLAEVCPNGTDTSFVVGPITASTLVCDVANQCAFSADLTDSWGDGWNGAILGIRQNGIMVTTFGQAFTTGTAFNGVALPICDGQPSELVVVALGTFPTEVGLTLYDQTGTALYTHTSPPGIATVGQVLYSFTTNCGTIVNQFCDNFDTYTPGILATQSPLWSSWAGGTDYAAVSTEQFRSAPHSMKIYDVTATQESDVVMELGDLTTGAHEMDFWFYVPATNGGYFNLMHQYAPATSGYLWAIEVNLNGTNGTGTVDWGSLGTGTIGTFNFNAGAWNRCRIVVDLDNDEGSLRVNNQTPMTWIWSNGSTNPLAGHLAAMNFYSSAPTGLQPVLYVDDLCFGPFTPPCVISTQPTGSSVSFCQGTPATLTATPGDPQNYVAWLNPQGVIVDEGTSYVTDTLNATTTFGAIDAQFISAEQTVGPLTNIAPQGFGNFTNGVYITVERAIYIDSMLVKSDGALTMAVNMWDHGQTQILRTSDPVSISTAGDHRIHVGMTVAPGLYFFNVDFISGAGQLFRSTDGASYPYVIQDVMSIDSVNFVNQLRYYYLFEWVVREVCLGATATNITANTIPAQADGTGNQVSVSATEAIWQFNGNGSLGATSYSWNFGDGSTGTGATPTHAYTANGQYTVELTIQTQCGPRSTTFQITVQGISVEENGLAEMSVYPNPTRDQLVITFESGQAQTIRMELVNSLGQQIWAETVQNHSGTYRKELSLGSYAKGIYHLRIHTATGTHTERISLQ